MKKLLLLVLIFTRLTLSAEGSSSIVISQVYGGGGNSGAILKNDFIELLNRTSASISVDGWTIQYASSGGSSWERIVLSGTIGPGRYYLVAAGGSTGGTVNLPLADATGAINLSATSGKVALLTNSNLLSGSCPQTVELVGYGSANCAEGTPTSSLSNSSAAQRTGGGCNDNDNNFSDFSTGSPSPRNSSSSPISCGPIIITGPQIPTGTSTSTPTLGTTQLVFPHFAQGAGYATSFTFNNLSETPTNVSVEVFGDSGALLTSTAVALTANGSGRTSLSLPGGFFWGWVRAIATPPAHVIGTETLQLLNGQNSLIMETAVLSAQPDTFLRVPVYEKDGFGTGVAVVNIGPSPASVTFVLKDSIGTVVNSATSSLNTNEHFAKYVSGIFPGVADFEGLLEIRSSETAAAVAFRQSFALGVFSVLPVSPVPTEVYFSPNVGIAPRLVQEIDSAKRSIDIAIYSFTLDDVADALIEAKNRGVNVRILADSSQANGTGSEIARLESAGFQLKRTNGGSGGILHHKFAVFDSRTLLTGSYNWSANAEQNNDENALFIRDGEIVAAFQQTFNSMWNTR